MAPVGCAPESIPGWMPVVSFPFFTADASRWPRTLARLRQLGPLDEDDARLDLAYLECMHREWMHGRRGHRFPGRRVLAARWGWGEQPVRRLLDRDDWHDPVRPIAAQDLRPGRGVAQLTLAEAAMVVTASAPWGEG